MRDVFLRHFPGFTGFTDDAGGPGSFASEESAFKAQRVTRIRDVLSRVPEDTGATPRPWLTELGAMAEPG